MDFNHFYSLDVVLVCGLPGAGKSHFANRFFKKDNRQRINRVEIRRLLYEMTSFGEPWKQEYFNEHDDDLVKHVERKIYEKLLYDGVKVLIDNTSVRISSRSSYVKTAQRMKRSIGVIFLNPPLKKCLLRNNERFDPVPDTVLSNLFVAVEFPSRDEGFKEALVVNDY